MANAQVWSNVQIAVESAKATALTISGITKATTGVVTYTGTDPSNGDYALLKVQGMYQLDYRVCRIANVNGAGNTFELEGVNTSSYDTFTSGTAEVVTFGTSLSVISAISASGGDFDFIDTTVIHSNVKTQIPGMANPITFNMTALWDPADAGLVALKAASDARSQLAIRITFAGGQKTVFTGYVGCTLLPTGSAQQKVETPVTFTMFGRPSHYSS